MNSIFVGIGGAARQIAGAYVGIAGTARRIVKAYVGVGGTARLLRIENRAEE